MAEIRKYFEDDTLANDWFEKVMHRLAWKMFDSQEDWIYMSGELGKGRNPMIRARKSSILLLIVLGQTLLVGSRVLHMMNFFVCI